MARSLDDIRTMFGNILPGWRLEDMPTLSDEERAAIGYEERSQDFHVLVSPEEEEIVVFLRGTSVTGTERPRPQIRVFTDKVVPAFRYARMRGLRFFCFVLCTSDMGMLKYPETVQLDEYLVSLEGDFTTGVKRADLRTVFDHVVEQAPRPFFKISRHEHNTIPVHAAFIRIVDEHDNIDASVLEGYLKYFDNRSYMRTVGEGTRIVYSPSILYEPSATRDSTYPWNLLVFGAPGTGKSHRLQRYIEEWSDTLGDGKIVSERVTFYEDYGYHQFVGSYMPVPQRDMQEWIRVHEGARLYEGSIEREGITYRFVPGPFASVLARAFASKLRGDDTRYVLVIEELNRANAASVFGDLFQLLDRDQGLSRYEISLSEAFSDFLFDEVRAELIRVGAAEDILDSLRREMFQKIRLPDNLYIWATMNSADQGVFPLDSAFKRRWSFLYMDINDITPDEANRPGIWLPRCDEDGDAEAVEFDWNVFRTSINDRILEAGFDEDRCIGYWFFTEEEMDAIREHTEYAVDAFNGDEDARRRLNDLANPLVDKLLLYLRQDVFRNQPTRMFQDGFTSLSSIRRAVKFLEGVDSKPVCITDVLHIPSASLRPIPMNSEAA